MDAMNLSRRQAALLAALLDADGEMLTYAELGATVGTRGVNDTNAICQYVHRLRALGLACVEVVAGRGLRLVDIPPDWTLESVLAMLDAMRRYGYEQPVLKWSRAA
jgi:hypothetical protein